MMFPDPVSPKRRVPCVGALIHDDQGHLLVVRRAREPGIGLWSVPGGRVERDETDQEAVVREVLEETSLHVTVGMRVGTVQRPGPGDTIYDIRDYACSLSVVTAPVAGDDAADVRWVSRRELRSLELTDGLWEALSEWGMLPA
jgi:8-oxo-dGTP diphosphatase